MTMAAPVIVSAAVEGVADEAVARRLIAYVGAQPGTVYGKQGKPHLKKRVDGFNRAARHGPWLVLVDLDRDEDCAPPLRATWLPTAAPLLCFRIAVRAVEAWLLADEEAIAAFLGVARGKVPAAPETLASPKQEMVNLARISIRRDIREDMVPHEGSGRLVGPAYASRLIEFAANLWEPARATERSDSLRRTIECLEKLARST